MPFCLAPEGLRDIGITFSVCLSDVRENVKVFEWTILRFSVMIMVTQIIYLGRVEVGDW